MPLSRSRQRLLCSGASVSDSAEEHPSPCRLAFCHFSRMGYITTLWKDRPEPWGKDSVSEKSTFSGCRSICCPTQTWGWAGRVSHADNCSGSPAIVPKPPARQRNFLFPGSHAVEEFSSRLGTGRTIYTRKYHIELQKKNNNYFKDKGGQPMRYLVSLRKGVCCWMPLSICI